MCEICLVKTQAEFDSELHRFGFKKGIPRPSWTLRFFRTFLCTAHTAVVFRETDKVFFLAAIHISRKALNGRTIIISSCLVADRHASRCGAAIRRRFGCRLAAKGRLPGSHKPPSLQQRVYSTQLSWRTLTFALVSAGEGGIIASLFGSAWPPSTSQDMRFLNSWWSPNSRVSFIRALAALVSSPENGRQSQHLCPPNQASVVPNIDS